MKGKPTGSRDALLCVQALGSVPPKPPDLHVSKPSSPLPSNQVARDVAPPPLLTRISCPVLLRQLMAL
jgi:hypothetical protein